MSYRSTGIRQADDGRIIDGELTLHGVTRQVPLAGQPTARLATASTRMCIATPTRSHMVASTRRHRDQRLHLDNAPSYRR